MNDQASRPLDRPKARLPRGFFDSTGKVLAIHRAAHRQARGSLRLLRLRAAGDAVHRVRRRARQIPARSGSAATRACFRSQDDDGQWLVLRYDLTAPLARYVAENFDSLAFPYRRFQTGPVFRDEKPGPGRFREFIQFDADTVGTASMAADAEFCMLVADSLEALGLAARRLHRQGQQSQNPQRHARPDRRAGRPGRRCDPADRAARHGQARPAGHQGRRSASRRRTQGRVRRFHQRRRIAGQEYRSRAGLSPRGRRRPRRGLRFDDGDGERQPDRRARRRRTSGNRRGVDRRRFWSGSCALRSGDRPRARLLHRPGVRGRVDFRNQRRRRASDPLRLGRRRRPL